MDKSLRNTVLRHLSLCVFYFSQSLIKSSTSLFMDGSQEPSNKLKISSLKLPRKHKHDEPDLTGPLRKLQRTAERDKREDVKIQATYSKEGSSLYVHALASSTAALSSADDVAKCKPNSPVVSPKDKEVKISLNTDRQQSVPKASRKLIFETGSESQKPEFVLVRTSSKENIDRTESKKEEDIQSVTDVPSLPHSIDSSPEIEILNSKVSRPSIEVVFVNSHSQNLERSISRCEIHAGTKRLSLNSSEVINIDDNSDRMKGVDAEAECSDKEWFLHFSLSPSQKSMDSVSRPVKCDSSCSASGSVDHRSQSSYKSSNASNASMNSGSVCEEEMSNSTKQNKKLLSGGTSLERHAVYTIPEEEEAEMTSQIQNIGSLTNSECTNGSSNVIQKKTHVPFSLTKKDIVSPEGSPYVTDSFTTFSKVKDVAQFTSVGPSQAVAPVCNVSELRICKRKRGDGKQDSPVISIVGSDSESDSHSTPTEVQKKARTENGDVINEHKDTPSDLSETLSTVLPKVIYQYFISF